MSESEKPSTFAIRDSSIAISWRGRKALRYVANAKGLNSTDELAETIIIEWLEFHHPNTLVFIDAQNQEEKTFSGNLKKKLGKPIPFAD